MISKMHVDIDLITKAVRHVTENGQVVNNRLKGLEKTIIDSSHKNESESTPKDRREINGIDLSERGQIEKVETDNIGPEKTDTELKHVLYDHSDHDRISETEPSKYNCWLVGSSIVRDLKPKLIYKYKKTRVTTLRDKTIFGATEFLKLGQISTNVMAYQVGSNDLEEKSPEEVIREIESLILSTQKTLPKSQIVINELLPRFYDNLHNRQVYETKRLKFNSMLHELSNNYSIRLVTQQNISQIHYLDGIHLNTDSGTAQYVTNIKEIINTLLDVKRDNTGTKMNRRQGKFHDTNRYTQRQDFRYRTYNYRNNRDVQDNTNQRKDFNINNRYHDNRNNDRQHYNTDRYDNRNNDRKHYNTNIYYEEGFDNRINSHQYEQSPDNTNLTV